jgi:hypothetical protein
MSEMVMRVGSCCDVAYWTYASMAALVIMWVKIVERERRAMYLAMTRAHARRRAQGAGQGFERH